MDVEHGCRQVPLSVASDEGGKKDVEEGGEGEDDDGSRSDGVCFFQVVQSRGHMFYFKYLKILTNQKCLSIIGECYSPNRKLPDASQAEGACTLTSLQNLVLTTGHDQKSQYPMRSGEITLLENVVLTCRRSSSCARKYIAFLPGASLGVSRVTA